MRAPGKPRTSPSAAHSVPRLVRALEGVRRSHHRRHTAPKRNPRSHQPTTLPPTSPAPSPQFTIHSSKRNSILPEAKQSKAMSEDHGELLSRISQLAGKRQSLQKHERGELKLVRYLTASLFLLQAKSIATRTSKQPNPLPLRVVTTPPLQVRNPDLHRPAIPDTSENPSRIADPLLTCSALERPREPLLAARSRWIHALGWWRQRRTRTRPWRGSARRPPQPLSGDQQQVSVPHEYCKRPGPFHGCSCARPKACRRTYHHHHHYEESRRIAAYSCCSLGLGGEARCAHAADQRLSL